MLAYELIHCDKDIIVVNKAPLVPCHSLTHSSEESLVEAVAREFPEVLSQFMGDREGGLCHRIDNGTSGLVVIARHPAARSQYRDLFLSGNIEKSYLSIVKGEVKGTIDIGIPIAHHEKNKSKMVAVTAAHLRHRGRLQEARTQGKVILSNARASLVRVTIGAGRRHQIRVHLASLGHPLFGDALYRGPQASHILGHALHAESLQLRGGVMLKAPCPQEWADELIALRLTQ